MSILGVLFHSGKPPLGTHFEHLGPLGVLLGSNVLKLSKKVPTSDQNLAHKCKKIQQMQKMLSMLVPFGWYLYLALATGYLAT